MRRVIAAFLAILAGSGASATTFGTDATALWWDPAESGWGVNVMQQNDILFLTAFAYGPDNQPAWYVGPDVRYSHMDGAAMVFTGAWYRTTGPWFGTQFDPGAVTRTAVGNVTFTLRTAYAAGLTYNVGTTTVAKNIVRQTWSYNRIAGTYVGAMTSRNSGCADPSDNGLDDSSAIITITQGGAGGEQVALNIAMSDGSCSAAGVYRQHGHLGRIEGSITCTDNTSGSVEIEEIEASAYAMSARFQVRGTICNMDGRLAGARRMQ